MRAKLSKFKIGDHVRLIDNTPAEVVAETARKNYYVVKSPVHGCVMVFAGDMEREQKHVVPMED